jgi:outer membrane protein TolC
MRWKKWVGGLALLLGTAAGCKQQVFMGPDVYNGAMLLAKSGIENNPQACTTPVTDLVKTPVTCSDPDRPARYLPLAEAIALALEQGNTGFNAPFVHDGPLASINPDFGFAQFNGGASSQSPRAITASQDNIKVLRIDPAIIGAGIESALSKFDAVWSSGANWNTTDRPVGTSLDTFQAAGQVNTIDQQQATVHTGIIKPLSSGGVTSVTFTTNYTYTNLPSRVNPSYQPTLQFGFEQPLLQGFGTEINEIRPNHPGSILNPGTFNVQPTAEGILLTRLRYDQQRAEFERNVHFTLFNTEAAYWNLYAAYWNLYAQESGLKIAYETWRIFNAKYQAGSVNLADFSQTRGQYELFRSQRLQALNDLLEAERQLRYMMGLPVEDGTRIVPSDAPTLAPYVPDWTTALQEGLALKPELILAREDVKGAQMFLIAAKNNTLPDVRFLATYDFNSIGSRLDGPGTENAFRDLADAKFSDWTLAIQGNIPLGFRDAHAKVRIAQLSLARSFQVVSDQELKEQRYLAGIYRLLDYNYQQIRINRAQREAYQQQLRGLAEQVRAGKVVVNVMLEAQRFYAAALAAEYNSIRDYNQTLIAWEYAKGTIMQHDNVAINEGALPACVQARAVDHQRERKAAIDIHDRPLSPICHDPLYADSDKGVLPVMPQGAAPAATALPTMKSKDILDLPPTPKEDPKKEPARLNLEAQSKTDAARPVKVGDAKTTGKPLELPAFSAPVTATTKPSVSAPSGTSTTNDASKASNFGTLKPAETKPLDLLAPATNAGPTSAPVPPAKPTPAATLSAPTTASGPSLPSLPPAPISVPTLPDLPTPTGK